MHQEHVFDEDIKDEDVPFDIVCCCRRKWGMPNASLLFHDTLLNENKELIKLPVGFIINRIGNKRQH